MKNSLQGKLIVSYLAVALLTVMVVSALIWLTSGKSLMNLVVEQQTALLKTTVEDYYISNGSLDGFFDYYVEFNRPDGPNPNGDVPSKPPKNRDIRGVYGLVDADYKALLPTRDYEVGQTIPKDMFRQVIAVEVDGTTIAYILQDTSFGFKLSPEEELFQQRSTLAIGLAALAGVLAAVTMGFFLSGRLLQPIRLLTKASQGLSRGDLDQQVPVTSQDELGLLTTTFNQMSRDLVQADQQRKRMTADITHDLSTPLQIISGYVDMLEEGEVTLTPGRIEIIKTEIDHLRRLVGDLTTLSQVEAGGLEILLQPVQPATLLKSVFQAYLPIAARQGVQFYLDAADSIPDILVDEGRMIQVLKNLLENAMRYTGKGGNIHLRANATGKQVELRVQDSGSGIEIEDLPYVFDRFYRADKARGANSGKMGLGLAICKALVTAQGGVISAESDGKNCGTTMLIRFNQTTSADHPELVSRHI